MFLVDIWFRIFLFLDFGVFCLDFFNDRSFFVLVGECRVFIDVSLGYGDIVLVGKFLNLINVC